MFQLSWILEYLVKQPQPISKSTQILSLGLSFWEWTTSAYWGLKGGQEMALYRRGCGWSSDVYMIVWRKSQEWKEKGVGHRSSEELWGVRILNLNLAFPDAQEEYLSGLNYRIYLIVCRFGSQLLNVWVYIVCGPPWVRFLQMLKMMRFACAPASGFESGVKDTRKQEPQRSLSFPVCVFAAVVATARLRFWRQVVAGKVGHPVHCLQCWWTSYIFGAAQDSQSCPDRPSEEPWPEIPAAQPFLVLPHFSLSRHLSDSVNYLLNSLLFSFKKRFLIFTPLIHVSIGKIKHIIHRVWYYLWFQASSGNPEMYPQMIRRD